MKMKTNSGFLIERNVIEDVSSLTLEVFVTLQDKFLFTIIFLILPAKILPKQFE